MKKLLFLPLLACQFAFAQVDYSHLTLQFKKSGTVQAKIGSKIIPGTLEKRIGVFSQWTFRTDEEHGFDVIVNNETHKILSQKNSLEAGGPFLIAASPDNKYVVFDYGTSPDPRDFSVFKSDGHIIFKSPYLGDIAWGKQGLRYGKPTSVSIDLNAETKKCAALGAAWQVQMFLFDGVRNKKLGNSARIECTN